MKVAGKLNEYTIDDCVGEVNLGRVMLESTRFFTTVTRSCCMVKVSHIKRDSSAIKLASTTPAKSFHTHTRLTVWVTEATSRQDVPLSRIRG